VCKDNLSLFRLIVQRQASPGIVIALVGNKLDLCSENSNSVGESQDDEAAEGQTDADVTESDTRKISTREAKSYAEEEQALFFETSAKTGTNVVDVFQAIAAAIPESNLKGPKTAGRDTQSALGNAATRAEEARVNLTDRAKKQQDNCAC
jgi:Ras-related protein Rab-5C